MRELDYSALANLPEWRESCARCDCPKWAHAMLSMRGRANQIAIGACGCGNCDDYLLNLSHRSAASGETVTLLRCPTTSASE
jgi:hypothetical protein